MIRQENTINLKSIDKNGKNINMLSVTYLVTNCESDNWQKKMLFSVLLHKIGMGEQTTQWLKVGKNVF